jgi:hypothetical protein
MRRRRLWSIPHTGSAKLFTVSQVGLHLARQRRFGSGS